MNTKNVLITGCSDGGIGSAPAIEFQKRNYRVFAIARNQNTMSSLLDIPGVTLLELDVTSTESITTAVALVSEQVSGKLDCLLNNAGLPMILPVLDSDIEAARTTFDVNYWGVLTMPQAFAPMLIEAQGKLVNVGSIAGYMNSPFNGVYAPSKAAMMSLSNILRLELYPFGVRVLIVVAGVVASGFVSSLENQQLPDGSIYRELQHVMNDRMEAEGFKKTEQSDMAREIVIAVSKGSKGELWVGSASGIVKTAKWLPQGIQDTLFSQGCGLDKIRKTSL